MNECKPRFLGVAVMHWARTMATELRDSRSGRRQGSSSDGDPALEMGFGPRDISRCAT